ncbi:MAG: MobC family plasmid mobilization relaxosome protein [Vicinamibacterales bacterium]
MQHARGRYLPRDDNGERAMPSRGYRKGISDAKQPRPHVIKSRTATATYEALHAESADRSMTFSSLVSEILEAHAAGRRPALPHARGPSAAALRELARLGNNLNQIAHQAHLSRLHLLDTDARACIAALNDLASTLAR